MKKITLEDIKAWMDAQLAETEVYDLLDTLRRYSEGIEATYMQTGAYEVALRLLED